MHKLIWYIAVGLLSVSSPLYAQLRLGDNLGSHKATKDLEMSSHNIKAADLVNAKGVLVGTATTLSNSSIALQVDGVDKAILVPRVTDLLNASTPSIPLANAVNGMIVYDLATSKFYHRQNNAWVVYVDAVNYVDRYLPQLILGKKTFKSDSGFVAQGAFGSGLIPATGAGARMMWYPKKAAFRVGATGATQWEDAVIGNYSVSMGNSNIASGIGAFAMGTAVSATGNYASAIGNNVTAAGVGSLIIGDNSSPVISNTVDNRLMVRYAGGYRFFTSADTTKGFYAVPAGVLKYKADYSTAYDDRSLVDRGYVVTNYALKTNYVDRYLQQIVLGQKTFKSDSGFVAQGTFGSGLIPAAGAGTRLMLYPRKAAFRAGYVSGTQWDDVNVANYSVAMGNSTTASGVGAISMGTTTTASAVGSLAIGTNTNATGNYAMGIGNSITSSGIGSVAIGNTVVASSTGGVAIGNNAATSTFAGALVLGDNSTTSVVTSTLANQFMSRYAGGYRFFTSADTTKGFFAVPAGVLKYKADYSASYDARSIVDRAYIDLHFPPKSIVSSGTAPSATGANAFAIGRQTIASGYNSFAYGAETQSTANESFAGGYRSLASGYHSVALGRNNVASGLASVALGDAATASATGAVAIGNNVEANADYSVALGRYASAATYGGSLAVGDGSTTTYVSPDAINQVIMRFNGGYRFYTNSACTSGSWMGNGQNGWSNYSDKRRKENFETIDAESFLMKIDTMKIGSWNYKLQDPKTFRHYGPMAQDFYGAFGKDSYGTIGCDTLICSTDFDGVNMIAIKGLVTRTNLLTKENTELKTRILALESGNRATVAALAEKNEVLNKKLLQQEAESAKVQLALVRLQKMMEEILLAKEQAEEAHMVAASNNTAK